MERPDIDWRDGRRLTCVWTRTPGKTPFVDAVSTGSQGRPRKVKPAPVKGFRKREIARFAKRRLDPGTRTITDGPDCWTALDRAGCDHRSVRTG